MPNAAPANAVPVNVVPATALNGAPLHQANIVYVHKAGKKRSFLFKTIAAPLYAVLATIEFFLSFIVKSSIFFKFVAIFLQVLTLFYAGPALQLILSLTIINGEMLIFDMAMTMVAWIVQGLIFRAFGWVWRSILSYEDEKPEVVVYTIPQGNPNGGVHIAV